MEHDPPLKQPKTQEDVDDAFETWLEAAEVLGICNVYRVISYFCPDNETDEVRAITFAVDEEALINHANMIIEENSKKGGENGRIWHRKIIDKNTN